MLSRNARIAILFVIVVGVIFAGRALVSAEARAAAKHRLSTCAITDRECLISTLGDIAAEGDTGRAFGLLKDLYPALTAPDFKCFDLAHMAGSYLAQVQPNFYKLRFTDGSTYCNYGLYQGYVHRFLLDTKNVGNAKALCDYIAASIGARSSGTAEECFRGIGQALPFISPNLQGDPSKMAAFAVHQCEVLAPLGTVRDACFSGAYSLIGTATRKGMLPRTASDPMALCREAPSEAVSQCEGNLKRSIFSGVTGIEKLTTTMADLDAKYAGLTAADRTGFAFTVGYDDAHAATPHPKYDQLVRACLAPSHEMQDECILGLSVGLAKNGIPGEQDAQIQALCDAVVVVTGTSSPMCPGEGALVYMKGFFTPEKFRTICNEFDVHTGSCDLTH